ncbi:MAG: amidohydrolase family protein [Dehalococcoidales bacterium]|jgi:predicted TIM-barrel fold metal-dependent hydrolase|nr:amidohydrolase family protein [Dehalococcoidales bacterium]
MLVIDMEHHAATPDMLEKGKSQSGLYCERYWAEDGRMKVRSYQESAGTKERLQFMDEAGIDMAVLTTNPLKTLEQCQRWNDYCASMVRSYPDRFIGFATIPPLGGKPALDELERAINVLGLKGVHIHTRNDGYHLDSPEMWPFYEKVTRLKIPVDIHVTLEPPGFDALHAPYALYYVIAREVDMLAETLRVCLGGVLEDFPDLVLIMNHFGGGVSAVMERLDAYLGYVGPGCPSFYREKVLISRPWREYFNKLYFNMAGREGGMAAVRSALTTISPQKLMFGTDWPFNYDHNAKAVRNYIENIKNLDLPREDIEAMLGGTAKKLLKI